MKYKILWDSLKETAESVVELGNRLNVNEVDNNVSYSTLLDMMNEGEKMFESEKWYNDSLLITVAKALGFSVACWGVLALVMNVVG